MFTRDSLIRITAVCCALWLSACGGGKPADGVPGAPSGLKTSAAGLRVTMSWDPPTTGGKPTGYLIESGSASGLSDIEKGIATTTPSFSAEKVGPGTYYVRVRAKNDAGSGPPSNESILVVPRE
jgi:fibronectin type III domain protein